MDREPSTIKLETSEGNNIKTHMETFKNERKACDGTTAVITKVEDENITAEDGTYYVDDEGHYYFQPGPPGHNVQETVSENASPDERVTSVEDAGEYPTVRIVPSDLTVDGEATYLLIVQQEEKSDTNNTEQNAIPTQDEVGVYDFDENNKENGADANSYSEDGKTEIAKVQQNNKGIVRHTCKYCHYSSPTRYQLARHVKTHSNERPHECPVCDRGFKTMSSLTNHVNTHTGTKPHSCSFCKSAFTTSGELVRHVRYRHTHVKPHMCTECDYASVELSKLKRHTRCHTGERPYQCRHCTYASIDTFKLKRHLRTHTGERPYICEFCKMCFAQSNSLKTHKLIHNIARPVFPCELCPTTCNRKADLRNHIHLQHTSNRPLECKQCSNFFPDRYSYKLHTKTHEGEKCFKCAICPYSTAYQRHLASHTLIHTNEKPFFCSLCDKTFRQKQLLRRHENLDHNPDYVPTSPKEKSHECCECGRQYARKGNLVRHMIVHGQDSNVLTEALKLGRAKRLKYVQKIYSPVEKEQKEKDEVEMEQFEKEIEDSVDAAEKTVETDADGQQCVVVEVIRWPEVDGSEPQLRVVAPPVYMEAQLMNESSAEGDVELDDEEKYAALRNVKIEKGIETCFGFDEDGDDDASQEDEEENNGKNVIG